MRSRFWLSACVTFVMLLAGACGGDGSDAATSPIDGDGGCVECSKTCPAGFATAPGEAGCDAVLPADACGPGTRPAIGSSSCVPVGVTSCAAGFVVDPSGWGCAAVVAKARCAGATREKLGQTTCEPLGDCNAPFPPAQATLFVNANYTALEIDATHFRTVGAALVAAPAGAVIAIDSGTYSEKIAPKQPVTILGRCAERTVFTTTEPIGPGLHVDGVPGVVVKNVAFRGFFGGVGVYSAKAELENVLVEDSVLAGLIVSNAGASLRVTRSVVRGTRAEPNGPQATGLAAQKGATLEVVESVVADVEYVGLAAYNAGSTARVSRSIFRDGLARTAGTNAGLFGAAIFSSDGADVTVEESAVMDHVAEGIVLSRSAAGTVRRSVVRGVTRDRRDFARGIEAGAGCKLVVEGTTISGTDEADILVTQKGSAQIRDTTTRGKDGADPDEPAGAGLLVSDAAQANVVSSAFVAARGTGIQVQRGGTLEADGTLISDVAFAPSPESRDNTLGYAIVMRGASILRLSRSAILRARTVAMLVNGASTTTLAEVLIADTLPSKVNAAGRAISMQEGSKLTMTRSALLRNREAGIVAIEASSLDVSESIVKATAFDPSGSYGIGVLVADDSTALLDRTTVHGSAGVGVAVAAAGGSLKGSVFFHNAVAVHVQDGVSLLEQAPADVVDPRALVVSPDTRFVENTTKVGSGRIPLPTLFR